MIRTYDDEVWANIAIESFGLKPGNAVVLKVDTEKVDLLTAINCTKEVRNTLGDDYKVFFIPKDIDVEYMTVASLTQWRDMVDKKIRSMCGGAKMGEGERE